MQEVEFAGKTIRFDMSPMASIIYTDEFNGADLCEDYGEWSKTASEGRINLTLNLRVLWACAKAVNPGIPSFRLWMRSLPREAMDVNADVDVFTAIANEYKDAFFPDHGTGKTAAEPAEKPKR